MRNIILYLLLAITPGLYGFNKVDEQQLTTKNYITNGGAEQGRAGFVRYLDAAATSPVDGTAGSPNASTTLTTTSSSPLAGVSSLLLTKDASNRQGEGFSYDFTIDNQNQAKVLAVSFDYSVSSAFVSGDSSDIRVWIYDKTNAVLIQPAPYTIQGGSTGTHRFQGNFQTASNSTSYRLIWHIATTNASAWTFKVDSIFVGREARIYGSAVTDWVSFTPTGSWVSNTTYTGFYRRTGDTLEMFVKLALAGAPTATALTVNLPSGLTIDTTKMSATVADTVPKIGYGYARQNGSNEFSIQARYSTTSAVALLVENASATYLGFTTINATSPVTWANLDGLQALIQVPISGWSSPVQMSNDADTRVVAARMTYAGSAYALGNSADGILKFDTVDYDTHGALTTGASAKFTAPVPGYYRVEVEYEFAASSTGQRAINLYKNTVQNRELVQAASPSASLTNRIVGSDTIYLVAGDNIQVEGFQSSGGNLNIGGSGANYSHLAITRMSGPATIAATETVAARGTNTTGASITSATDTVETMVIDFDTHGALSTSGLFTAPISGKYALKGCVTFVDAIGTGNLIAMKFKKNSSTQLNEVRLAAFSASSNYYSACGSDTVRLLVGDTVGLYAWQNTGAGKVLSALAGENYFAVERIGSY